MPTSHDIVQFFNEDFFRSLVASAVIYLLIAGAAAMSFATIVIYEIVASRALGILRTIGFFLALTAFFFIGLVLLKLSVSPTSGGPSVISDPRFTDLSNKLGGVQSTVDRIAAQQAQLFWQPMTTDQKTAISNAMSKMGSRRFLIWRNPSSDCSMLADEFAGISQSQKVNWNLLMPPYEPIGIEGTGITIVAPSSDAQVESLKQIISAQLGVNVGRQPPDTMMATGPDGKPIDIGMFIGVKSIPAINQTGTEKIRVGNKTATISVSASPPYSVNGRTSWGATFTYEVAAGHFTATFSTPAAGPSPAFNWQIFHYD